jgi:hypothetical protein
MGPWWTYILTSLPPTIAAVAALIVALRTHTAVNSRMDKALRAERFKGELKGRESERADAKRKRARTQDHKRNPSS